MSFGEQELEAGEEKVELDQHVMVPIVSTKDDLPINPGSLDTLLLSNQNLLMKLAPGEGRKPLYLTTDRFMEELAYPCVFAGHCRDLPEDLSILKKSKSDILRLVTLFDITYILNLLL